MIFDRYINKRYAFSQYSKKVLRKRIKSYKSSCVLSVKNCSPFFHIFSIYLVWLLLSFLFYLNFLSVDQLGGNVYSFVLGIITIRVISY